MRHFIKRLIILSFFYTSSFADCSSYTDDFYINEVHTWDSWVEIYAKNPATISNWSVEACTVEGNPTPTQVCETVSFSYTPADDGYFVIVDFTLDFHQEAMDFVLYDDVGAVVNYFRVGRELDTYPLQIAEASACGLDTACNIFDQSNNGQRNFQRQPDGACTWDENTGKNSGSPDDSNDGGLPPYIYVADYHFDECLWDGTPDEVFNNTSSRLHGTSVNGANTGAESIVGGRSGYFDGIDDYVQQDYLYDTLKTTASLSFWIKTTQVGNSIFWQAPGILGIEENGGRDDIFWGWIDDIGRIGVQKGNNKGPQSLAPINDGVWHHIVLTRDKDSQNCKVYVDGVFNSEDTSEPGIVGNSFNRIGSIMDTDGTHTYFEGYLDELKVYASVLDDSTVQSIYNNESLGRNFDGALRVPQICGGGTPKDGNYTAVDYTAVCNAQINWNDNIKTKIVNDTFDLSILAKDISTDLPLEANITKVTLKYYPDGDNSVCTGISSSQVDLCTDCGTTDTDGCLSISVPAAINNKASKCVEVVIEGKDKTDTAGTSLSTSISRDDFSTRPDTYDCSSLAPSMLIAEHPYTSNFIATPLNLISATSGYTTTSVALRSNVYMRTGELNTSLAGAMTPSSLSFTDGNTSNVDISFNNVGDVGIDINDSTWANVDSDDTIEVERVIHAECRRLFRPDHFLVQLTRPFLENNSTDFTYLSNLTPSVSMSAWTRDLNVTITAQGEANATMTNYSAPNNRLYANDVTLSPNLSLPLKHSSATKLVDLITEDSSTITGFSFLNGVSVHTYNDVGFNYDRSFNTPVNPFRVDGSETYFSLNVQDNTYPIVTGDDNTSSDANATFYYGRLNPSDITATSLPAVNPMPIEVYDDAGSTYTSGMKQNSLFWYIHDQHTGNSAGYAFEAIASSNTLIDNVLAGFTFNYNSVVSGEQDLDITAASTEKGTIHLKTQEWLWYVPSGFGSAYDDGAGTDCTMHPCFKFSLMPNNSVLKIESGDFNGTVIPDVNRSDYIQKGVKLFR